jgi:hypothetical protein
VMCVAMVEDDLQKDLHVLKKSKYLSVWLPNESDININALIITCSRFNVIRVYKCVELHRRNLFNNTITENYAGSLIKENEMVGTCSTYGRNGKRIDHFSRRT